MSELLPDEKNTMDVAFLVENDPECEEFRSILRKIVGQRGKNKGLLKENCPSYRKDPEGHLAWQAVVENLAPARISPMNIMIATPDERLLYTKISDWARRRYHALNALERGFRWNLWALDHNKELYLESLKQLVQ